MIRAVNLAQRLKHILAARGKTADFTSDCRAQDDSDGQSPWLAYWDAVKLGAEPTQAEVDAASTGPTPEEQRLALDQTELLEAKVDSAILGLINATPAQRIAWARNNFPSLTLEEQNRLGLILNILAVAVRPHVR